eukprot:67446-Pelagomonas_calceolata.AAC.1
MTYCNVHVIKHNYIERSKELLTAAYLLLPCMRNEQGDVHCGTQRALSTHIESTPKEHANHDELMHVPARAWRHTVLPTELLPN